MLLLSEFWMEVFKTSVHKLSNPNKKPSLVPSFPSLPSVTFFTSVKSKMAAKIFFLNSVQGVRGAVAGAGGIGGAPYKKNGGKKLCARGRGGSGGGGVYGGGGPYKKMRVKKKKRLKKNLDLFSAKGGSNR